MKPGGALLWSLALPLALAVVLLFAVNEIAHAQFALPSLSTGLTLSSTPEHPAPNSTVRTSTQSLLVDLAASNITWYVNGVVIADGVGVTETSVVLGPLGSETVVRVEVRGEGALASATGVFRPTEMELLWEGDSYVPPFYRGRALPTAGGSMRIFAIPHFLRPGSSSFTSPDELIYTWRKNNRIIQSVRGRGQHSITMDAPVLFGTDTISVEARTADGALRGFASVRISSVEPTLILYENHPIFGVLYHRALASGASIPETEVAFSAVPYFAPVQNPDSGLLSFEWRVNNTAVTSNPVRPSTITLNAEGTDGRATLELTLTHVTNFFLSAKNAWSITLAGIGGSALSDPFRQ